MASESKEERFTRVAEARANGVLDKLRLLSQTANRNNYAYNDAAIKKIFRVVRLAVRDSEAAFRGKQKDGKRFHL